MTWREHLERYFGRSQMAWWSERAGVLEYYAHLPREDAERAAYFEVCRRDGLNAVEPEHQLVMFQNST